MPKSRNRKEHKDKVKKFKEKNMTENEEFQVPPVRQVPVWKGSQKIEMTGIEFEAIYNFITNVQSAYGACQSIMNKNILNGAIKMNFEKLNAEKTNYVPMSEDEQKTHREEFEKLVDSMKQQADEFQRKQDSDSQEGVPRLDALVDQHGAPVSSEA